MVDRRRQNPYNQQMEEKILHIYKYGDDVLKLKAKDIKNIDEKIAALIKQMTATMYYTKNGVGLAAPQVGESLQLSVIDVSFGENKDEFMVLINPEIIEAEGEEAGEEGCLSLPGITIPVKRSTKLLLKYIDINGKEQQREFEDFKARVIQHEIDHLDGVLIVDRISSLKKQLVKKEIKRLKKDGMWK